MSFLEQFLKESSVGRSRDPLNSTAGSGSNSVSAGNGGQRPDRVSMDSSSATATRRGMSIESDEGDVEDNRAGSITSSRSNMSEVMYSLSCQVLTDFLRECFWTAITPKSRDIVPEINDSGLIKDLFQNKHLTQNKLLSKFKKNLTLTDRLGWKEAWRSTHFS